MLTWEMVDDKKNVKALSVAKGYQDPDPKDGFVDTLGRVSFPSSHLQVIFWAI